MNRRNRMLLVLLLAIGLASAASFTVFRAIKRMPVREVEVATVHVAVAVEDLPTGTRITKEQVKLVGWPAASRSESRAPSASASRRSPRPWQPKV